MANLQSRETDYKIGVVGVGKNGREHRPTSQ